jgi:putative SOS response-associated peptidase YedK
MCGRFRLDKTGDLLETFDLAPAVSDQVPRLVPPRRNICPTEPVEVVRIRPHSDVREMKPMLWGLIPSWSRDPAIASKLINARSETAHEKASFRSALKRRRCLIPADAFYEWDHSTKPNQPYRIGLKSGKLFGMAGLWETWCGPDGEEIETCTILTTEANELLRTFHHRMPVIIPSEKYTGWLEPGMEDYTAIGTFLSPYFADEMIAEPVSKDEFKKAAAPTGSFFESDL